MARRSFPLSKAYMLLEPGPVVLLSTEHRGRRDVMAMSWHLMMEFEPPQVGCVVSNRDETFAALKATKQCVINVPTVALLDAVIGCGNTHGSDVDKFARYGLTAKPAKTVAAPLIAECWASLECIVVDTRLVRDYCFFVLEVQQAWVDTAEKQPKTLHHRGNGKFMVAGREVQTRSRAK